MFRISIGNSKLSVETQKAYWAGKILCGRLLWVALANLTCQLRSTLKSGNYLLYSNGFKSYCQAT